MWLPSLLEAAPLLLLARLRQVHLHEQRYLIHLSIKTLWDAHAQHGISGDVQPYAMTRLPIRHHMIFAPPLRICKALSQT